ncbi:NADH-quinone oxidoreductase subunit M [Candidatus Pelagibacter sp.]|jgi:NADH-quinone oxidoreductase subunit M|nr:NADH-quinone oxidoreductase subunit M [Candidatus Pelagibacter sp.]MDB4811612.1 NADH-quinone oxidoreductase subunit M [Candidatus Pelagibacter sp.]MDC0404934.1 NADH-quinone oxidoreductase subunit M [Candidatus Pelagibacter sp.]MDC1077711.1 NADH-quinone oxidoreductase subunit M [Candidatus Pelagibacter sp.]
MNFPILSSLILLPTIGALFLIFLKNEDGNSATAKYVSLFASVVNFLISIYLWISFDQSISVFQFVEDRTWIEGFINYKVGVDGISILFIILTTFITPLCIISVNNSVKTRLRDFLIAILIMESFMIGVFCALDLVVFYLFFEAGLIPMFLIIGIWGGPKRVYSAFKFFLYTLLGSVLMLVAIISIYWISGTTDVTKLYELGIDAKYQNLLWLAFFSSFAVKTPMWPVHTWLPDAHVEAPTAGSVLLAAILLKMAGYGFIRFSLGLFPIASEIFTPLIYALSVIAIIVTSLIALMQEDMKKLIAYSSVAHMGFVTLGIFTIQQQGIEGSIIQMISHGLVSAALFLCVGVVYDRMHSRMISSYGGIVTIIPKYSILFMLFTLAALGLPGTSGFIGEFLILMGVFKDNFLVAVLASLGVILGAAYMLWLYKRVVFGKLINENLKSMIDLNKSEYFILACLAVPTLFFGFYPDPLINTIEVSVEDLINMYNSNIMIK